MQSVKVRLKVAKARSGMTNEQIADRTGLSRQTVSFAFAKGTPLNQKILTLKCICDAMDYPFTDLFADESFNQKLEGVL